MYPNSKTSIIVQVNKDKSDPRYRILLKIESGDIVLQTFIPTSQLKEAYETVLEAEAEGIQPVSE